MNAMPNARLLFLVLAGLAAALPAGAAVFTPTTTDDTFDGACDAHCSLREAVAAANASPGLDEVRLVAGVYPLTRNGPGEDAAATGDLDVVDDLRLLGAGARTTVIDGQGLDRILEVRAVDTSLVEIADLTLRNGHARNIPGDFDGLGGAILSSGPLLKITRCHIHGNVAELAGGGIHHANTLEVRDSTLSGNTARLGGGALSNNSGFFELSNVTISGNRSTESEGGAIVGGGFGPLGMIDSSTITQNSAPVEGGIVAFPVVPEVSGLVFPILRNTILAGNNSQECALAVDAARNLTTGIRRCNPPPEVPLWLGPLADNGGPTPTHALLPNSPAIDAGPATPGTAGCTGRDQRGRLRPADGNGDGLSRCDIGAFEMKIDGTCTTDDTTLCLGGRFRVTAQWTRPDGQTGAARAVDLTPDAGYFWFFHADNVEVIVKSIDACVPFDRFWIFLAGLTNVDVEVRVEDVLEQTTKTYHNPQGQPFAPIYDTETFATCP